MAKDQKAKKLKNTDPLLIINGSDQIRVRIFFAYLLSALLLVAGQNTNFVFSI